jgi:hypothetical protein
MPLRFAHESAAAAVVVAAGAGSLSFWPPRQIPLSQWLNERNGGREGGKERRGEARMSRIARRPPSAARPAEDEARSRPPPKPTVDDLHLPEVWRTSWGRGGPNTATGSVVCPPWFGARSQHAPTSRRRIHLRPVSPRSLAELGTDLGICCARLLARARCVADLAHQGEGCVVGGTERERERSQRRSQTGEGAREPNE